MTTYPAKIDNTQSLPTAVDNVTPVQGLLFNRLRDALLAIEEELGVQPSGVYGTLAARLGTLENITGNLRIIELEGDLGGTLETPLVIGLQGFPVSTVQPNPGDTLYWNGIAWIPIGGGTGHNFFFASGDLSGDGYSQTVIGLRGLPLGGSAPTTGQALIWNGSYWGPETAVSFIAGGDLTGTSSSQRVAKLQGTTLTVGTPAVGNLLTYNGSAWISQAPAVAFTAGGDLSGTATSQTVIGLNGAVVPAAPLLADVGKVFKVTATNTYGLVALPTSLPPNGAAGGDLSGTYPNPTVATASGHSIITNATSAGGSLGGTYPNPTVIEIDGYGSQDYGGTGNKVYVVATETKLGVSNSNLIGGDGYTGQPRVDSFVNGLLTTVDGYFTIATVGINGNGLSANGSACCDFAVSLVGIDTSLIGNKFWRADLVFSAYWTSGVITLYNSSGSAATIVPTNIRSNAVTTYSAQATTSGNQVLIQIRGGANTVQWSCIGQLQWLN